MGNYFCEQPQTVVRQSHRIANTDENQQPLAAQPEKGKLIDINQYICSSISQPLHQFKQDDFQKLRLVGRGAFGLVYLVRLISNKKLFAMKQITKKLIVKQNISELVLTQRKLMTQIKNDFIIKLFYAFQDKYNCTFIMEYALGGDVCQLLYPKDISHLSLFYKENLEVCSKFILACVILGLECLHSQDIHYRDLKPENVMLMENGYFKLIDFGLVRSDRVDPKSTAIAGTPLYFAPQVLKRKSNRLSDLWALGVFAYQLFLFQPPFKRQLILSPGFQSYCKKIQGTRQWKGDLSQATKDLIDGLLKVDPCQRLGAGSFDQIKNHDYFSGFDWSQLSELRMRSPFEGQMEALDDEVMSPCRVLNPFPVQSVKTSIRGFTFYYDK